MILLQPKFCLKKLRNCVSLVDFIECICASPKNNDWFVPNTASFPFVNMFVIFFNIFFPAHFGTGFFISSLKYKSNSSCELHNHENFEDAIKHTVEFKTTYTTTYLRSISELKSPAQLICPFLFGTCFVAGVREISLFRGSRDFLSRLFSEPLFAHCSLDRIHKTLA